MPWKRWGCSLRTHSCCKHWLHMSALLHPRKSPPTHAMRVLVTDCIAQCSASVCRLQKCIALVCVVHASYLAASHNSSCYCRLPMLHAHIQTADWLIWRCMLRELAAELKRYSACKLSQRCRMQGCTPSKQLSLEGLQQLWTTRDALCDRLQ